MNIGYVVSKCKFELKHPRRVIVPRVIELERMQQ